MYRQRRVAVVMPAFNEARLVGKTLASTPHWVDHVVVVDDASQDDTYERARATARPDVETIRHERNAGVGRAICTGYRAALRRGADVIVVMAADGQMDPDDLPALLDPIVDGRADYVKGNRFRHHERSRMPFPRRVAGKVLAAATRLSTRLDIDDSQCGYTALAASAAEDLPIEDLWPRYGYPNDLLGMLSAAGKRVAEVVVRPVYADEESGVRPYHFGVVLWVIMRRTARNARAALQRTEVPLAR